jgi:flagellar protein FliO/FliZ
MFNFIQVSLSLLLVLALIFVAFKLLQRVQEHQPQNRSILKIRSSVMVGPREKVILLDVDGQRLLIGVGPGQVRFLTHLATAPVKEDLQDHPDETPPQPEAHASWLKQQLNKIHGS